MPSDNETLVRRFFEEFCNQRRSQVADELIAEDYVSHGPQAPPAEGPDGVRERVGLYQESVDGHWNVEEIMLRRGSGDRAMDRDRDPSRRAHGSRAHRTADLGRGDLGLPCR